jgi:shikimate kinase
MSLPPNIILIGFMGSGKTTTGGELARALGFQFLDTDRIVEKSLGMKVAEIFETRGEALFREEEKKALLSLEKKRNHVLATGGGLWMNPGNRRRLSRMGWCVWLRVSPEQAWKRVSKTLSRRPLLSQSPDPLETIRRKNDEREPSYALAHFSVDTDNKRPKEVVREIIKGLKKADPFDLSFLQK